MPGWTHESLRQALSVVSSLQRTLYLLAVGPPRSEITPRKSSIREIARTSRSTFSAERLWMHGPSCSVMLQNVQPPKQPRMVTIECFTVPDAGTDPWYEVGGVR